MQLDALVNVAPPGEVAQSTRENVVAWVTELNLRFALVRHGVKVATVDFKTPSMGGRGVSYGIGFLDVAGDVWPWLDVLAALVPNEAERRYVLHWIAWKI